MTDSNIAWSRAPVSISDLPDELLVRIFSLSVGYYRPNSRHRRPGPFPRVNVRAAIPLLLVCKRWGAVAFHHTSLWANIDVRDIHATPVLLKRSGAALLSVDWDIIEDLKMRSLTSDGEQAFAHVLAQFSRIAQLNLCVKAETFQKAAPFIGTDAPVIRILKIDLSPFDDMQTLNLRHASRLQLLTLRNTIIPDMSACTFPELRVLDFELPRASAEPRLEDVLSLLSRTPLLRKLALQSRTPVVHPYRPTLCPTVALPHLIEVELTTDYIDETFSALARVACHLTFSPCCSFTFVTGGMPPEHETGGFSLVSTPPQNILPSNLQISPGWSLRGLSVEISCDEMSRSGLSTLRWTSLPPRWLIGDPFSWSETMLAMQERLWDYSHIEHLVCEVVVSGNMWFSLLSRCPRLKKIVLSIDAATQLLSHIVIDEIEQQDEEEATQRVSRLQIHMPATLEAIELRERLASDEEPHPEWGVAINMFSDALAERWSEGIILDEFAVRRTIMLSASDSVPEEPIFWGWEDSESDFANLRGVVNNLVISESVEIEPDDDSENIW